MVLKTTQVKLHVDGRDIPRDVGPARIMIQTEVECTTQRILIPGVHTDRGKVSLRPMAIHILPTGQKIGQDLLLSPQGSAAAESASP